MGVLRWALRRELEKASPSFLKKRSKRLLYFSNFRLSSQGPDSQAGAGTKVSWFVSSDKNILALSSPIEGMARAGDQRYSACLRRAWHRLCAVQPARQGFSDRGYGQGH
jgi:hypothetical protein